MRPHIYIWEFETSLGQNLLSFPLRLLHLLWTTVRQCGRHLCKGPGQFREYKRDKWKVLVVRRQKEWLDLHFLENEMRLRSARSDDTSEARLRVATRRLGIINFQSASRRRPASHIMVP